MLSSTTAIDWLLRQGARVATPGVLLSELCNRLAAEGLPLSRALLTIARLDPLLAASRWRWQITDKRASEEVLFHGMTAIGDAADNGRTLRFRLNGSSHEIAWVASDSSGFNRKQRVYLEQIAVVMAAPLQVVIERETTRSLLRAYLGRRSAEKVLGGMVQRGVGETIEAVIWISDLRDFTALSLTLRPEQLISALNDYCGRLVGAIHPFGGEVLKFIGDGLLAIFPLASHGTIAACSAALSAVRAARHGMRALNEQRAHAGLPSLPFGVALHLGAVVYGNIGAPDRLDFTAIGPAVNLTSRLERLCRRLQCPVLISDAVAEHCSEKLAPRGRHSITGLEQPLSLFTLPELADAA